MLAACLGAHQALAQRRQDVLKIPREVPGVAEREDADRDLDCPVALADGLSPHVGLRSLQFPERLGRGDTMFDPEGRRVSQGGANGTQVLWDLEQVPDAKPLVVGRQGLSLFRSATWAPDGRWLVAGAVGLKTMEFWPVSGPRRRELPGIATSFFWPNL